MTTTVRFLQSLATTTRSYKRGDEVAGWDDTDAAALFGAGIAEKVISPQVAPYPAEVDDTDDGASVDMRYAGNTVKCKQIIGTVGGTTPSLTGKIQESTDGVTWTDVASGGFTAVTAANNFQEITITRTKRYLRHSRTVSGTTPTFVLTAVFTSVSSVT